MHTSDMDLGTGGLFDTIFRIFPWIFGAVVLLVLCGAVLVVVGIVRSRRVLREADSTRAWPRLNSRCG